MENHFLDLQAIYNFLMLIICMDNCPSISSEITCSLNCDLYLAGVNAHCAHPCGALKECCEILHLPTDVIKPVEFYGKPSQITYRDIEHILETHDFSPWAQKMVDYILGGKAVK